MCWAITARDLEEVGGGGEGPGVGAGGADQLLPWDRAQARARSGDRSEEVQESYRVVRYTGHIKIWLSQ